MKAYYLETAPTGALHLWKTYGFNRWILIAFKNSYHDDWTKHAYNGAFRDIIATELNVRKYAHLVEEIPEEDVFAILL